MEENQESISFWARLPIVSSLAESVRNKVFAASLVGVGLALLIAITSLVVAAYTRSQVNAFIDRHDRVGDLSLESVELVQRARRAESDFRLSIGVLDFDDSRTNYLTTITAAATSIRQNMATVSELTDEPDEQRITTTVTEAVGRYETLLNSTVDAMEARGYKDRGLAGQVRSAMIDLEAALVQAGANNAADPVLLADLLDIQRNEKDYHYLREKQFVDLLALAVAEFKRDLAGSGLDSATRQSLNAQVDRYEVLFNQLVATDTRLKTDTEVYQAAFNLVEPQLLQLRNRAATRVTTIRQELDTVLNTAQMVTIGAGLAALLLGVLAAAVVSQGITRQVDRIMSLFSQIGIGDFTARAEVVSSDELGTVATSLNAMLDNTLSLIQTREERDSIQSSIIKLLDEVSGVAEGDLTRDAEVSADVTGAIADSFNYMLEQLRRIVSDVQDATLQVSSSAAEIQTTAEHLAQGSEAQAMQISNVAAAIEEMAVSIQQVSENAALSATVGEQATANARQGAQVVQDTIGGMGRIREQVQETAKRIKRLGESSQEIGEIVQLIDDIADRTSILALNASIQAAMAGEAGRGFAVVAEEVERLAERSTQATKQIATLTRTIQGETNEAVAAMESTTREVVDGSQLANQAGQALREIENVSERLAELIQSISLASKQQARGSEALAQSMDEISEVTQQTAAGTKQAAVSISNLATLAEALRNSVSAFRLPEGDPNGAR